MSSLLEVAKLLEYDEISGQLYWKDTLPNLGGKPAGGPHKGYIRIQVEGTAYLAHNLAFCIKTGRIPLEVDHKDRNGLNNAWLNLRECTKSQNQANTKRRENTSGYKGVSWDSRSGKWLVRVSSEGIRYRGGLFKELKEAVSNANKMRAELHGEFAIFETFIDD